MQNHPTLRWKMQLEDKTGNAITLFFQIRKSARTPKQCGMTCPRPHNYSGLRDDQRLRSTSLPRSRSSRLYHLKCMFYGNESFCSKSKIALKLHCRNPRTRKHTLQTPCTGSLSLYLSPQVWNECG